LRQASLLFLAVALVTACRMRASEPRPSFVLVCVDTLRVDRLGCHGYRRATSPRIDALAGRGMRFSYCFSTYPQTAASVASLFTSLHPSAHKKTSSAHTMLTSSVAPLAETFREAGYRTAAVATNPFLSPGLGYEQGFERFYYISGRKKNKSLFGGVGEYPEVKTEVRESANKVYGSGDAVNQAALDWFGPSADPRPFFLYLHYMDAHSPYTSPAPYDEMFVQQPGRAVSWNGIPKHAVGEADLGYTQDRYDGQIRYIDDLLATLLEALRERGLLERTHIVFVSDHGEEFLEHGGLGHGETLFREMLHVPLFFVGPGIPARVENAVVSTIDVYPTLCELAGIEPPAHVQGRSLVPLLTAEPGAGESARPAFAECVDGRMRSSADAPPRSTVKASGNSCSLVDEEWHLIHRPSDGRTELYRYRSDPQESEDLSSTHPQEVARLLAQARRFLAASVEAGRSVRTSEAQLDEEARRQLEELGYAGRDDE
jgi:arylsulfatase